MEISSRLVAAFTIAWLTHVSSADAADLTEAVAAIQKWQRKFIAIRVKSRITSSAESNPLLAEAKVQSASRELDWVWEDSGRFYDSDVCWNDGKIVVRELRMADRRHYYPLGFSATDRESAVPVTAAVHENSLPFTASKVRRQPFWVLWDDDTRTWLGDRLKATTPATTHKDGLLEISGDAIGMPGFVIRLDPKHGYLPDSAEYVSNGSTRYKVEEFQEIQDGFWFPRRGTIVSNHNLLQTWEVTEVQLNPELPDSLFVPPLGAETYITNSLTGKQYWHGGKAPAGKGKGSNVAPATPSTKTGTASANPEHSTNWSLWLTVSGVLLVALAVWKSRKT